MSRTKTRLLLDVNYLCYRAFYTTGHLGVEDIKTGVIYGFFKSLQNFMERFNTNSFVFCFDHGPSLRKIFYPPYKANRRQFATEEEKHLHQEMEEQILKLKTDYLLRIGFRNVLYKKGYEADDILAKLTSRIQGSSVHDIDQIIISADHDLFQLLSANVQMWNPKEKKFYTIQYLRQKLGVDPAAWHMVKAIAGCSSDNIQGIERVGEKTAIKYLNGELDPSTKAYQAIECGEGERTIARNVKLTKLPIKGMPSPKLRKDKFSREGWQSVVKELGLLSMPKHNPFISARRI